MAKVFTTQRRIRFSHCDPAGIVYFVNFFDMISGCVEDWFRDAVGLPFNEMHIVRRLGFPIVNTGCEFFRPCHLGDQLVLELAIAKLGSSSIDLAIDSFVDGRPCFKARHTVCVFSSETYKAVPIPAALRTRMEPYVVAVVARRRTGRRRA